MTILDNVISREMSAEDAIRMLASDLGEVESELEFVSSKLHQQRAELRNQISEVLAYSGHDKMKIAGFGTVMITSASAVVTYDKKKLDRLISTYRQMGDHDTANDIEACRDRFERPGGLRITRDK